MIKRSLVLLIFGLASAFATTPPRTTRVHDLATFEGVRENPLIGYGIVVGLNGTGDRRQTMFTMQTLASAMQRMGVQIPPAQARVNNVAAVFVTATLPPFAAPGTHVDVTVSSVGDAKSLQGGVLLLTALQGADGHVYADAQGALTLGGYSVGAVGNSRQSNHPTVGRIPAGAIVERAQPLDLRALSPLHLQLNEANFTVCTAIAAAINIEWKHVVASAVDGRRIAVNLSPSEDLPGALARIENLQVSAEMPARVVVNERTGTIVMGRDVTLGAVSILHGNLTIEITTDFKLSQPQALSGGQTAVIPQTATAVREVPVRKLELAEGATVEQLVNGLQAIGATAQDVISILQAMRRAGALQADLEVL